MNSTIKKLSMVVVTAILVSGCQTAGWGLSDKGRINKTMANWKKALLAEDLDKVMALYSDDYVGMQGTNKEARRGFLKMFFDEADMANASINLENAKVAVEQDKAKYGPVEFTFNSDKVVLDHTLQKENGKWLIVGSKWQGQ